MQMDKGLLTSQNALEISIFLKSLDQVPAYEIFSRLLSTSVFQKYLCKYNLVPVSLTAPFEREPNQTQCLIWLSLAALWGVVTSLGHSLHVHHLLFRTPSLGTGWDQELHPGRKNGTQQGWMGRHWRWLVTNAVQVRRHQHYKPFLVHLPEQISIWYEQSKNGDR